MDFIFRYSQIIIFSVFKDTEEVLLIGYCFYSDLTLPLHTRRELVTQMPMHCLRDLHTTTLQSLQLGHVLP